MRDPLDGLFSDFLRRRRLTVARPYVGTGWVLDFGCGVGKLAEWVEASRYLGVDRHGESLALARAHYPHHTFVELDRFHRECRDDRFDRIIGLAVIEHLLDPGGWLEEMCSRLKPAGRIVLTTPHPAGGTIHALGAQLRLFSREGADEHEELLGLRRLRELSAGADLELIEYRRFLAGANQLVVLQRAS